MSYRFWAYSRSRPSDRASYAVSPLRASITGRATLLKRIGHSALVCAVIALCIIIPAIFAGA